jgi:hypothetical protein
MKTISFIGKQSKGNAVFDIEELDQDPNTILEQLGIQEGKRYKFIIIAEEINDE